MPTLPSASSSVCHRPSPGTGSKTLRRNALAPRARVWPIDAPETSMPRAGRPRAASASTKRPGPQPMSMTGPEHRLTMSSSTGDMRSHESTASGWGVAKPAASTLDVDATATSAVSKS